MIDVYRGARSADLPVRIRSAARVRGSSRALRSSASLCGPKPKPAFRREAFGDLLQQLDFLAGEVAAAQHDADGARHQRAVEIDRMQAPGAQIALDAEPRQHADV